MRKSSRQTEIIPVAIHYINAAGLLLFWGGIYIATYFRFDLLHAIILILAILHAIVYIKCIRSPGVVLLTVGITAISAAFPLLCTASMYLLPGVLVDVLSKLETSPDLAIRMEKTIGKFSREKFRQVGEDRLFWNRIPNATISVYDNSKVVATNKIVDETGYTNRKLGMYKNSSKIDIFFSGDSVLEGIGVDKNWSDYLADEKNLSVWNLSTASYGPRQKVAAILKYAVEKQPKVVVVDFFSGNDLNDANEDGILSANSYGYQARFTREGLGTLFYMDERYRNAFKAELIEPFASYPARIRRDILPLALLHLFYKQFVYPHFINIGLTPDVKYPTSPASKIYIARKNSTSEMSSPGLIKHPVSNGTRWFILGLTEVLEEYAKLSANLQKMNKPPALVVLYNPHAYEVYRGACNVPVEALYDEIASLQEKGVRLISSEINATYINITPYLRRYVLPNCTFIYNAHDLIHWNWEGHAIAGRAIHGALQDSGVLSRLSAEH